MDKGRKKQEKISCCGYQPTENSPTKNKEFISGKDKARQIVRERYAKIAMGNDDSIISDNISQQGLNDSRYTSYSEEDLQKIPVGSDLGLGSGNPVKLADIQPGETVIDLGSGAGVDCFLAAQKTGKSGKVIGVDMTPEMIDKARFNAQQGKYTNVEFRLAEIEHLPVGDNSVDVIISNCVINLSTDKSQVFREVFRVLKPGGRLIISDIILEEEFPEIIKDALKDVPGCITRAETIQNYIDILKTTGFRDIEILEKAVIYPVQEESLVGGEKKKLKMTIEGKEIEVEVTPEEAKKAISIIQKAHIRAFKPKNN